MSPTLLTAVLIALLSPPSGRPPTGPVERTEPREYEVTFEVAVQTETARDASYQQRFELVDTPIVMPVVFRSAYSNVEANSLGARLWLGDREDPSANARSRLDDGFPYHTHLAVIPIPRFTGQNLRWQLRWRCQSFSSKVDEAAAQRIPWPREWPDEVKDGLQPQMYIESEAPIFAESVQLVSRGNLRLVAPYIAAKDLVRYVINNIQVSGDGVDRQELGLLHGLELHGALRTAQTGQGSPHDLVCACVAVLRAAGIPARPVIGIKKNRRKTTVFVSWAEFYLPNAGWIPFDPDELRGKGIRSKDVREPWKEFGTMDDLNRRVPIAFHFMPAASVQSPESPALWGWQPRPKQPPSHEQIITLGMVSKGRSKQGDPAARR